MARSVWKVTTWEHEFGCRIMGEHLFPATAKGKLAADTYYDNNRCELGAPGQYFTADKPILFWFEKKNRNTVIHKT